MRFFRFSFICGLVSIVCILSMLIGAGNLKAAQSKVKFEKDYDNWFQNGMMHYEKNEYAKALMCFFKANAISSNSETRGMIDTLKKKIQTQHNSSIEPLKPIPVGPERNVMPVKNNKAKNEKNVTRIKFFRKNYGFFIFPAETISLAEGDYFDMPDNQPVDIQTGSEEEKVSLKERVAKLESKLSANNKKKAKDGMENSSETDDNQTGDQVKDESKEIKEYFVNIEDVPEVFSPQKGQIIFRRGKRHGKLIALTFDDGPHPTYTPKLLKILKDNDVKATFFMIGNRVNEYKNIVAAVQKDGHEIGNHSYTHPFYKKISHEKLDNEIKKSNDAIKKATGGAKSEIKFYRPPYGSLPQYFIKKAESEGFYIVMWSLDSKDYQGHSADNMLDKILKNIRGGDVMLFHDIHPNTIKLMGEMIPILKKAGFTFTTLTDIYGIGEEEKKEEKKEEKNIASNNSTPPNVKAKDSLTEQAVLNKIDKNKKNEKLDLKVK